MTERVRAKRLGWNETNDGVTRTDFLDPYEYTDDDLEGELEKIDVKTPYLAYTNYIVDGQVADPNTIEEITTKTASAATFIRSIGDQPRDSHGRWTSGHTSDQAAHDLTAKLTKTLTGDDHLAVKTYGNTPYRKINGGLRKNKGDVAKLAKGKLCSGCLTPADNVKRLDRAIENSKPLTKKIGVYRGMNSVDKVFGTTDPAKLKGKVFTDHGFMSTTTQEDVMSSFSPLGSKTADAMFYITVPRGKKALNVDKALGKNNANEREVLLPRGTSIRITNVEEHVLEMTRTQDGWVQKRLIIDAEVV